ncbi:D-alanyl-D-alanine carboxypeptidase [Amphibacillus marinus]|uniref:D-alanyl-D-alanine carboxypeptidase n=1 Tax=Amphibacillus marinus TaxID=872970 RepID=A0A1H8Q2P9_9BACI|nr:M15 family metallopeptidase [Amphibacillus marinus]SEO48278.1 D-alanyl-D-alanine carboxypeptidase [Amphibacillus marinus]
MRYCLLLLTLLMLGGCNQTINQPLQVREFGSVKNFLHNEKNTKALAVFRKVDKNVVEVSSQSGLFVVSNPDDVDVYVNKQRQLPDGYVPPDLIEPKVAHYADSGDDRRLMRAEAAEALEALFEAATTEGLDLVAMSGYRSYDRQAIIFQNNVDRNGEEHARMFSAQPGTSEHQTGLAMDISAASASFALEQAFSNTDEGSWLAEQAHKFGFIIRYPEDKMAITGYAYEPWHVRYVGNDIAQAIYQKNLTLEEYFGYHFEEDNS